LIKGIINSQEIQESHISQNLHNIRVEELYCDG
jgi:hypothetical protein